MGGHTLPGHSSTRMGEGLPLTRTRRLLLGLALAASACGGRAERQIEAKWPNGQPRCQATEIRVKGRWLKQGHARFWFEDGRRQAEGEYDAGLEIGLWKQWYDNNPSGVGLTCGTGNYVDGKRNGKWKYTHAGGQLQQEGTYDMGKRVGTWRSWYADGTQHELAQYSDGDLTGKRKVWHPDGKLDESLSGIYESGDRVSSEE